jgi:CelD/BcsL family acetyltransferase involved in cellulose biosynthesis
MADSIAESARERSETPLLLQEVRDLDDLEWLRPAWATLHARCEESTPFHGPEWLLPWARRIGRGALRVLAAWRGNRLTGLLPLQLRPDGGCVGRVLELLGAPVTDYQGALLDPGPSGAHTLHLFWDFLLHGHSGWDRLELSQLGEGDPLLHVPAPVSFGDRTTPLDVCPRLALPASAPALCDQLPRLAGRLDRGARRLAEEGRLGFELAHPGNIDELVNALFRLHQERWRERALPGVLAGPTVRDFHRQVATEMLAAGKLRLCAVRLDGIVVSVVHAFTHGRTLYLYISGFDPAFARFSPGLLAIFWTMQMAAREGLTTCDLLRGEETYKQRFAPRPRPTYHRQVVAPGSRLVRGRAGS